MSISSYMNLKSFHPGNFHNQKKVWIAEQKDEDERRKKADIEQEYKAEQQEWNLKAQMAGVDKDKLALNFMYKEPPGLKEAQEKLVLKAAPVSKACQGDRDKKKLCLQEKLPFLKDAPREGSYTEKMATRDRPFGLQVRNVKCIKCGQWGHQSSDRECPKFFEGGPRELVDGAEIPRPAYHDPAELIKQMREEGLTLRKSALGRQNNVLAVNQQLLVSSEDEQDEAAQRAFVESLSKREKKRLLRRLKRLDESHNKSNGKRKRKRSESRDDMIGHKESSEPCIAERWEDEERHSGRTKKVRNRHDIKKEHRR